MASFGGRKKGYTAVSDCPPFDDCTDIPEAKIADCPDASAPAAPTAERALSPTGNTPLTPNDNAAANGPYVRVKTLQDKTHQVPLTASMTTVRHLKAALVSMSGMGEDEQRLIFRGKFLDDASLLATSGIEHDACLHLIPCPQSRSAAPPRPTMAPMDAESQMITDARLAHDLEAGGFGGERFRVSSFTPLPGMGIGGTLHADGAVEAPSHLVLMWQMRIRCLAFVMVFFYSLGKDGGGEGWGGASLACRRDRIECVSVGSVRNRSRRGWGG